MNTINKKRLCVTAVLCFSLVFAARGTASEDLSGENITGFDLEAKAWAQNCNRELTALFERFLSSGALTVAQLFDTFYIPVPGTDPPKYNTQYNKIIEKSVQTIIDRYMAASTKIVYVFAVDRYGYLPAFNSRYSHLHTGNLEDDFKNNRANRILNDRTGRFASKNKLPYLIQRYSLDGGEKITDLSTPIFIRGRHWGAVRIGYKN